MEHFFYGVLFLTLTLAPFATPPVVLATAVALTLRARRRWSGGRRRGLPDAGSCALLALGGGAAALGAYAYGVMTGFYILDPEQMCAAAGAPGEYVVTRMTLPVSVRCVTEEGAGTELVPAWVNPTVLGGIALCVLTLGATASQGLRGSRPRPAPAPTEARTPEPRTPDTP
ncbi:hypothetical protein [Streptomyces griseiscabiei]|uniref:Integral membrane protein n=1 Tax=Streptomyces griseiscabiei TaxID=2993540 RepID=A0ABU4KZX2_9ACTN|nr:hypothetical protein [Streptomyces griseiscabiei]MDX2908976.1 hypothetical protein [Streptomyces griseiscabiei]